MNLKELDSFKISDAISFHDELNPNLWDGQTLRPEVKEQLLYIAKDFLEELGVDDLDVVDITVSGSNAAFSYTPYSDLDLHILVDLSKLDNNEIYKELFNAKKTIYNDTHDISIHGVPVELYVQDSREPVVSLGEYSILHDEWLRVPTKRRANLDQTATKAKYEKLHRVITKTLQSKNILQVDKVLKKIRQYRQAGLDKGGEFGPENLAFKVLRKQGLIKKLYNLRDKLHSEHLTIDEDSEDEIHNYEKLDNILKKLCRMVIKGQISMKDYGMVAACVLDPDNNIVAGLNMPSKDGKRIHAERVAVEKYEREYGEVPEGSIIVTTLSPCNEPDDVTAADREGRSCTDYLNGKGIKKVYCGYIDPTQTNDNRQFNLMETSNKEIREECKKFADTFLDTEHVDENINPEVTKKDFRAEKDINIEGVGPLKLIAYNINPDRPPQFRVEVLRPDGKSIGYFRFIVVDYDPEEQKSKFKLFSRFKEKKDPYIIGGNVSVWSEYQKKGIATEVYKWVKSMGNDIRPSDTQTAAGKAMWKGFEKNHSIEEDSYSMYPNQFSAEKTLPVTPYGNKEREFRGSIAEASGYIPSEKEKNDPRFKTALTVDVKPDSIKKNAKAFSWLTNRAGVPPIANANGKF